MLIRNNKHIHVYRCIYTHIRVTYVYLHQMCVAPLLRHFASTTTDVASKFGIMTLADLFPARQVLCCCFSSAVR